MKKIIFFIVVLCVFLTSCKHNEVKQEEGIKENETRIIPLTSTIDINNLKDCTVAISLNKGDVYVDDNGALQMKVTVYDYDLYDMIDMSRLKVGDIIVVKGKEVPVSTLERNNIGTVIINGGLDQGGYELGTDESGVFFESGYNDAKSYYPLGEATIRVSADFKFIDRSDLDKGEITYYPGDFLIEDAGILYYFSPHNTSIVVENGQIIQMTRIYTP